jgi:hypothetical protein
VNAPSLAEQWELAAAVAAGLRGWQPDDGCSLLESVEVVALGRAAAPAVEMRWQQQRSDAGTAQFGLVLTVTLLVDAQDYEEHLAPPERARARDLVSALRLAVYEPHEHPHPAAHRLWFDYLP